MSYDAWKLQSPYNDRNEPCPVCGSALVHDTLEQSVSCEDCEWQEGVDWDNVRDAKREEW